MRMHVLIMQLVEKVPNGKRKFVSRLYSTPLLQSSKAKKCSAPSTENNVFKISLQRLPGEGGALSWEDRDLEYDIFYL